MSDKYCNHYHCYYTVRITVKAQHAQNVLTILQFGCNVKKWADNKTLQQPPSFYNIPHL